DQYKFAPDYRFLAIADSEGILHLLDFQNNGERMQSDFEDVAALELTFSPRGKYLLVRDSQNLHDSCLMETNTGAIRHKFKAIVDFHCFSQNDEVFVFFIGPA